jgi:cephalosporin hydroxylase
MGKRKQDFVKDFRTGTPYDNQDSPTQWPPANHWDGREFSDCNQLALREKVRALNPSVIVEIGVARLETSRYDQTSTAVFLQEKRDECIYVGIDTGDRRFVQGMKPNTYTLQCDSADTEKIVQYLGSLGIQRIDFLFIDGWHSINQVLAEWRLTEYLAPDGVVGLHDVNYHPGPRHLVENLSDEWSVDMRCPADWGIAFVTKK